MPNSYAQISSERKKDQNKEKEFKKESRNARICPKIDKRRCRCIARSLLVKGKE